MPQTKGVIKGKSTVQNTTVSFYVLDTAQDFLGVDNRVVQSSGFVKRCIPNIFLNLKERI